MLVAVSVVSGGCKNSTYTQAKNETKEKNDESLVLDGKPIGLICNFTETEKIISTGADDGETKTESKEEKYIINAKEKSVSFVNKFGDAKSYAGKKGYKILFEPNFIRVSLEEDKNLGDVMNTSYNSSFYISRKTLEYTTIGSHDSSAGGSLPFTRRAEFEGKGKCEIVNPNSFKKIENKI